MVEKRKTSARGFASMNAEKQREIARKGGRSAGFVLTILLVFVYYLFSLVGVSLARQGKVLPGIGVWAGNFFFFFCGLLLLWRVDRMPLDLSFLTRARTSLQ